MVFLVSSVRVFQSDARGGMKGRERVGMDGIFSVSGGGRLTCRLDEVGNY